jgi:hypothetical protein
MIELAHKPVHAPLSAIAVFQARAEARAILWAACVFDLAEAVDVLQRDAARDGLIEQLGQDGVQAIIATAFHRVRCGHDC